MKVSVIILARNAAATIARTLQSLLDQSFAGWEAIVIDDGSSDESAATAARFAGQDPRIRAERRPHAGVSTARNAGIALARHDWLLFLDADDWILPPMLERMTDALAADPELDGVHCGWVRIAPDGTRIVEESYDQAAEPFFPRAARTCPFAIHSFVVRRSLVEAVGGFDTSFPVAEDWVLWQRIARTGARIGGVGEVLACIVVRPDSLSADGYRMLETGLRAIDLGHAPDPRVPDPHPDYAAGMGARQLASYRFALLSWSAGLVLGHGGDARPLLRALEGRRDPDLDPQVVADGLFRAIPLALGRGYASWPGAWPGLEHRLGEFLLALESHTAAPRLARRARAELVRLIWERSGAPLPFTVGTTRAVRVEVTDPIPDLCPPAPADRLCCHVELEGIRLGVVELPACDGLVPADVLADAIAAEFAWPILGRFFEHTARRDRSFAKRLPNPDGPYDPEVHDRIGWALFLQEIWARPDWPEARFYKSAHLKGRVAEWRRADGRWLEVEVSEDLPGVKAPGPDLDVVLRVGGVAVMVETINVKRRRVHPDELRALLTQRCGFELCRAAVREGLLGRPIAEPASLRARLAAAAAAVQGSDPAPPELPEEIDLAPGTIRDLDRILPDVGSGWVIGRRARGPIGASISRRAMLPAAAAREIIASAAAAGEPVLRIPGPDERPERVLYAPGLIWRSARRGAPAPSEGTYGAIKPMGSDVYGRDFFESLFSRQSDPWKYTNSYEQTKYEQTLSLLPDAPIERALELACAEGHFTTQLAPRVASLIAADISRIALERAAERCAGLENIRFLRLDVTKDSPPGRFDLIVCSEVLYYVGSRRELHAVALKIASALRPGGHLLTAHANVVTDEPDRPGFDWDVPFGAKVISEVLAAERHLSLVKELRTPLYRIQLFRRSPRSWLPARREPPEVIEVAECTPPPPQIACKIRWQGGSRRRDDATRTVSTRHLPILMYHRVAPMGSSALSRYRVTPESFEEQIRYLHDVGYYSIRLDDWQAAMAARRPLPGRAALITFDDGYRDFLTYAWPILRRYDFTATIFLVADAVGGSNHWDRSSGEEIPLLVWEEIRQLQREGVEFGSHSATHPPLTMLTPAEVAREAARSRAILLNRLGRAPGAFAYPYGDTDRVVQALIGSCGYSYGLTCRPVLSSFRDCLLALPRIEVAGSDGFPEFVAKLHS